MPLITETYYLSLTQDNRGILRLRCSQDDTLRTVNLKLYNNGSIFVIPSGVSASISGVKQNGAVFSKPCTISLDRESVVLQLSSDITNVDGIIVAEIVLNDGEGGRLGTSNFIIQVEKNPIRAGVVQDTETPVEYINDFIEKIQTLTARLNNLITPSGDASLAEVVDARIGILDSTTYQTLGSRLNAEFQRLSNALNGVTILESTGDTTDRTSEILSKLNAYGTCKLGKGDFYVNSLVMPEGSYLTGSGSLTRIILPSSVTNGYVVKPRSNCIIENISFYGGFTGTYSELIASGSSAQRHCIILDRFDNVSSENVILNNVFINSFVGSAIIQRYTVGCHCEDVIIDMCYAGIDISNASYDGQLVNVSMSNTRFGVVQNGSNFIFTNCVSKDSAYHIMSDQQNTGCTFSSCSFSDSSLETTSKLASISNAREGITFDNCLFDSSLSMLLNACDGIVIKGTNFVGSDTFAITVSNSRNTLLLITDCIADVEPVVTNAGTAARITSCYLKDGTAWAISEADITVDDELDSESENPVQNKVINRKISELKADLGSQDAEIYNIVSGSFTLNASDFEKGGIGNSGENSTYRSVCRTRNKKVQYTAEKIVLTATSGYKVCVAIYTSYNLSSWTESIALGTLREIPANTYYRIFIDKTDGSETDISTLLSAITVVRDSRIERMASSVSALDGDISVNRSILSADGGMVLYFEKGSVNTSGDSAYFADSRIRTGMLSFGADLIFSAKDSTLTNAFYVFTYNSDATYKDSSGWVKTYNISRGTKFRIMASLTPNENTSASVQSILSAFTYKFDFMTEFDPIPAYYFEDDYLDGKISDIISYYALSPSLLTFGFITDTHMLVNAGQGFKLLKYIDEHTNSIPFVIFGGDCIGHTQSKDDVYAQAGAWIDYMSDYDKRRVLQCRGNHDLLGDQGDSSLLSRSERYMYLVRNQNMVVPSINNFYYYYDVPYTDVRIIVVDDFDGAASGGAPKFTQTQIDWILGTALNVSNKSIVFITHNTADPDLGWYADNMEPLHLIMDALKTKSNLSTTSREMALSHDFTGDTNTFVCCLCGHGHNDESHVDASGVLSIMTNCDGNASSTSGYDRTVGTVNEQCFDVVTIDTENQHIYMTRIGAGNDRDFSY